MNLVICRLKTNKYSILRLIFIFFQETFSFVNLLPSACNDSDRRAVKDHDQVEVDLQAARFPVTLPSAMPEWLFEELRTFLYVI